MWKVFSKHKNDSDAYKTHTETLPENLNNMPLSSSLINNANTLKGIFTNCADVFYREFFIDGLNRSAMLIFINELTNRELINQNIIQSLMNINKIPYDNLSSGNVMEAAKRHCLEIAEIFEIDTIGEAVDTILDGNSIFLLDGDVKALKIKTIKLKERNVTEANIEKNIRGPKAGFTENGYNNLALLRRIIKSPRLKVEERNLGRETRTIIDIAYMEDIANDNIIAELRKRLDRIDIDSVLASTTIEELIEDKPFTIFPQMQYTERPDKVAAALLQGRIAIFTDGTPVVLMLPAIFVEFLQSPDDYYERYIYGSAIRLVRYLFLIIALLLPGTYVAIISYHKEMIPTPLFINVVQAAHGVPFPVFIEALLMELTFEALREAGLRLPGPANQTVGIVGVLVIGNASVEAGIVSPIMIVVIAITAIASFTITSYDMGYTVRILRFIMLFLGAFLGLYGIMLGILVLIIHMVSLRSFGVDYLSPLAPTDFKAFRDVFIRVPWWGMKKRPGFANKNNLHRIKPFLKPEPPTKDNREKKG